MGVKMFGNRGWFDFHWGFIYAIIIKKRTIYTRFALKHEEYVG